MCIPLASLLVLAGACDKSTPDASPSAAPAGQASYADLGIALPDLDDEEVEIVSPSADSIHVLVFWAAYCTPAVGELTKMQAMLDRLGPRGLELYAISIDGPDTVAQVPGIVAREAWTFPVLFDADTSTMSRWNPKGDCPFYVVLDADGNVITTHQGYVKGDVEALEQLLNEHFER